MRLTRREFLNAGGRGLLAASALAQSGCARDEGAAELDERIPKLMKEFQVPGVSLALIRKARVSWSKGFGVGDRSTAKPVDDDTIFSAQSMSKPVFAYRVMKLAEQGALDLDAPLTMYTPELFVMNDPRLQEITARRVLSHTTGLPNWRSKEEPLRINFAPGSKWMYSGEGYHYLQSVVTRLTGHTDASHCGDFEMGYRVCATDFGDSMEANVLRPFKMTSSGYVPTPEMQKKMARRHDKNGEPIAQKAQTAVEVARYGSAGSLMTTALDYAKFLIEMMQPKPADDYRLNAASHAEMVKPVIDVPGPVKMSWALGWQVWHLDPGDMIAHGGDDDGWHCMSGFSPVRKTGFVIMTNGEGGASMIYNELLKTLAGKTLFS
jgi:CubicO group peptidase (beta-lactamase class C family)